MRKMSMVRSLQALTPVGELITVSAESPVELVESVRESSDPSTLVVKVDSAALVEGVVDHDVLVALASVLVVAGVESIETAHERSVRRIFDMHAAINAGDVEVLT